MASILDELDDRCEECNALVWDERCRNCGHIRPPAPHVEKPDDDVPGIRGW
ncbi:hypothetical protein [Agrococcus sp. DT81.2]|uniref:hypothetical protein n=1 Tax=Agrococcus sp. DT81.2 TaxID=3393414 RepID=UPI003CE4F6F9